MFAIKNLLDEKRLVPILKGAARRFARCVLTSICPSPVWYPTNDHRSQRIAVVRILYVWKFISNSLFTPAVNVEQFCSQRIAVPRIVLVCFFDGGIGWLDNGS